MSRPLLNVTSLRKHFQIEYKLFGTGAVVRAVDDIDFAVNSSETLGIVGESGSGKSTIGKLIMHLISPDTGVIEFDGVPVTPNRHSLRRLRRGMQMVFQDSLSSLNPRLTVEESLAYGPKVHNMSDAAAREKARDILDQVGLNPEQFRARYPHELSGGQRQRVNIARALALDPKLVILDESVSALDKSVEAQILNLLGDLQAELGLTYIFISHDLHVVRFVSTRVMVMYLGVIVEAGAVDDIYGNPRHPYTQALLAAVPTMDRDRRITRPPLSGDPPNPINPPSGCRFRTRCPYAEPVCATMVPVLVADGSGHQVACHMMERKSGHSRARAHGT